MTTADSPNTIKSRLASMIRRPPTIESTDNTPTPVEADSPATSLAGSRPIAALIDAYFEQEEPTERDTLFDVIIQSENACVDDFLRIMTTEDRDPYSRAAAQAELARRGHQDALDALNAELTDPESNIFFHYAVDTFCELQRDQFYDVLRPIWQDIERDIEHRCHAMLAMAEIDSPRALADFEAYVDSLIEPHAIDDELLEIAIGTFGEHHHAAAKAAMKNLHRRIEQSNTPPEDKRSLLTWIDQSIHHLTTPPI